MAQRHKDALTCHDGAINPIAICNAIANAVKEIDKENGDRLNDPAVFIMVYQLAHITGTNLAHITGTNAATVSKYCKCLNTCKEQAE